MMSNYRELCRVLIKESHFGFIVLEDGTLRFHNWLRVLNGDELKKEMLVKAHNTRYLVHSGGTKM